LSSLIGTKLKNRFKLYDRVGSGGFSSVYLARDEQNGQIVAVKILHEHLAQDPTLVRKFHEELAKAARLQHPNVVSYLDQGDEQGMHFLVMEFLQGQTLAQVLKSKGRLPVEQILSILTQVAQALQAAEGQGIVHRDLKPENLMILPNGQVKVMDFGIAKDTLSAGTGSGIALTPRYASPEQILAKERVDIRSDLYSLGVILYEMAAGRPPFQENTPVGIYQEKVQGSYPLLQGVRSDLPGWLAAVQGRLMAPQRERRYQHPGELLADLARAGFSQGPSPGQGFYPAQKTIYPPVTPKGKKMPVWIPILAGVGGLALVLVAVLAVMGGGIGIGVAPSTNPPSPATTQASPSPTPTSSPSPSPTPTPTPSPSPTTSPSSTKPPADSNAGKAAINPNRTDGKNYIVLHLEPNLSTSSAIGYLWRGDNFTILGEGGPNNAWYNVKGIIAGEKDGSARQERTGYLYKGSIVSAKNQYYIIWPTIPGRNVRIFAEPSTTAKIIDQVNPAGYPSTDDPLVVIDELGNWYQILSAEGDQAKQKGWVSKDQYYIRYRPGDSEP